MIASKLGIPVVPIRIEGLDRVLHKTWKMARPGRVDITFGPPLRLDRRRLPGAGPAGGRRRPKAVRSRPAIDQNSLDLLFAAPFGLRGIRSGLPTTPNTWIRESAALGTKMRWFWKPGSGGTTEKPIRVQLQQVVRKDSVHGVAIAKMHPQPQALPSWAGW